MIKLLLVVYVFVVCDVSWFKGVTWVYVIVLFPLCDRLYIAHMLGVLTAHHLIVLTIFSPQSLFMSSNSSTSPLSFTDSENGDNDNNNQNSHICDATKPLGSHTVGGGKGDHACISAQKRGFSYVQATKFDVGCSHHSPHSPTSHIINPTLSPFNPIANPEIGDPNSLNFTAHKLPFFGPPASPPIAHMEELITLCLLGKV